MNSLVIVYSYHQCSFLSTMEEKLNFTKFLCVSNRRKNEKSAPVGIRTRVEASKGPHDWPLHHRSVFIFEGSPERIRTSVAGSKGQND
jgi:hypothetical protein